MGSRPGCASISPTSKRPVPAWWSSRPKNTSSRGRFSRSARRACASWTSTSASQASKTCSCRSPAAAQMAISPERIRAVLLQEAYNMARSVEVLVDLPLWSLITAVVFGFVTRFLSQVMTPIVAQYLYMGTLLWEIIRVAQYSMSVGALWNVWSHNLNNMFITTLSMVGYVIAQMLSAAVKALILFGVMLLIAAAVFDFNLLNIGPTNLLLLFFNLLFFAYSVGLLILGIILRLGTRIQALAWGLVLIFQPLTPAYYPLAVMTQPLQVVARAFPPPYVFESARAALADPVSIDWSSQAIAAAENVVYFAASTAFFASMYRRS